MFLEKNQDRILHSFEEFCRKLPALSGEICKRLETLDEDTALAMKFYYGYMPYSDAGNYPFEAYLDYAKHGVFLRKNVSWCRDLSEEMFLEDVLYYRVNEEEIKPCREFFYEKIFGRIFGMSVKNAILEVNYWCAQEAAYQSTDERTSSAWDVYRKGYGRCGEESVFAVNALRSVGIPARQVYVPNWAHCDDNHAWVEVWCDGEWHYLGACEPEAVLDKGWFTNASSRAMMVHSRSFYPGSAGKLVGTEGITRIQNQLARYTGTKKLTISVTDKDGNPAEGVRIAAEVLNYSEFSPVAKMVSGADGKAELETGLGSLHIFAEKNGAFGECLVNTHEEEACGCVLGLEREKEVWVDFDMIAPEDSVKEQKNVSRDQEAENNRRTAQAAEIRKKKTEAYTPDWKREFLPEDPQKAEKYMSVLSSKDREDADPKVLAEHYEEALVYEKSYPEEIFLPYIWNPRIGFEVLTKWRRPILDAFTDQQKEQFIKEPEEIWNWIEKNMKSEPDRERLSVYTTPAAALKLGFAEKNSRYVLFVAIARSLGIPSRLNKVDGSMEYWKDGQFVRVLQETKKDARLTILGEKDASWGYFQNWSIAKREEDGYHSLIMWEARLENGRLELDVEPGEYRVLTANRLPTGNIFAGRYDFCIEKGEYKEVTLTRREACLADMLQRHTIPDYELTDGDKAVHSISELTKDGRKILFWLDVSKEPTEHILNELTEMREEYCRCQDKLFFIVRGPQDLADPTFMKCRKALPDVKVLYDVFGKDLEMTARRMYVAPDKLPLLVVTDKAATGIFAASGYSVGMADMLLRVLKS